MPKRKRMSFAVKRKRQSLTPSRPPQSSKETRPRGRPKKPMPSPRPQAQPDDSDNDETHDAEVSMADIRQEDNSEEEEEEDNSTNTDPSVDGHPRLTAETVYVRKDTISKRWDHLDPASQKAVRQIFVDVARPVIASKMGDRIGRDAEDAEGKSAETQQAIEKVVSSLSRNLHKMPVPPKTSFHAFDYERTVRETAAAEAQLSEQMAGIATLRVELQRSEAERVKAEQDKQALGKDIDNHEADLERRLTGKFGRLLRAPTNEPEDSATRIRLVSRRKGDNPFASDSGANEEIKKLMTQLSQHILSIHSNRAQTADMELELEHTKATLDDFLQKGGGPGEDPSWMNSNRAYCNRHNSPRSPTSNDT